MKVTLNALIGCAQTPYAVLRRRIMTVVLGGTAIAALACQGEKSPVSVDDRPPQIGAVIKSQAATVGTAFVFDASMLGTAFTDPKGGGLTYSFSFSPAANGLASTSPGQVTGIPTGPGIIRVTITARDIAGDQASQAFPVVVFAAGLTTPTLPAQPFGYSDAAFPLPAHFKVDPGQIGPATGTDNTPASNPTTDAGATLGRVLFYDKRLSVNDGVACGSCHQQAFGFSDTARLSRGFAGGTTKRHAMGLANARFYQLGRFFWDERAATLEDQVLQPIQDPTEMGMTLSDLVLKVEVTGYYLPLFQAAFGSPEITADRISRALAQFVRSLVSTGSRFDSVFDASGVPDFSRFTAEEKSGRDLFFGPAGCHACHATNASVSDAPHNNGLDPTITDAGAGSGRFKAPSLRNVAVRPPFMHDGRFQTLSQVVEFYDSGVQLSSGLDSRLRAPGPSAKRLNLSQAQRDALVAYLRTLTDPVMLTSVRFANPF